MEGKEADVAVVLEDRAAVVLETALTDTVPRWKRHGPRHMEDVEVLNCRVVLWGIVLLDRLSHSFALG